MTHEFRAPQTDEEWRDYHAIRERVLWTARGLTGYDRAHPDERAGAAAALRRVAVREDVQGRSHGLELLRLAEAFARSRGAALVRSNVDGSAVGFYRKVGYERVGSPHPSGTVPMAKAL